MSCVWKHPKSPYWIGQFTDATGRRVNRSTKQINRKTARDVVEAWEKAAHKARLGELTQTASIKVLSDLMEATTGDRLNVETIESFLRGWLKSRADVGRADTTSKRYESVIDGFIEFLPAGRRKASIGSLSSSELERWRNEEVNRGKRGTTAEYNLKIICAALNSARRKGLTLSNPAEGVEPLEAVAQERDCFTPEELGRLLTAADAEWRGMILLGVWCGLRIGDAGSLTWEAVNLDAGTLTFFPSKTAKRDGKPLVVAMHPELVAHLRTLPAAIGKAPLFPKLHGKKAGSVGGLSNKFSVVMKRAGIVMRQNEKHDGKDDRKSEGRAFRSKGFHALRHTMISRLADSGVSADVRRAMAGHASDAVHRKYTHLSIDTQRKAIGAMKGVAN